MKDAKWWEADDGKVHETAVGVVTKIRDAQSWREEANAYHAELYYGGTVAAGLRPGSRSSYAYEPSQIPHNLVRQAIDTMTANVSNVRPMPVVQTSGGEWKDIKLGKKASQYLEGEFYRQRFHTRVWPTWVRDACTFGSGIVSVTVWKDRVFTDRVLPNELFVDEWDAKYGSPRNFWRLRDMDRGVVTGLFGKNKKTGKPNKLAVAAKIADAGRVSEHWDLDDALRGESTVDRITMIEGWHLCDDITAHAPSNSGKKIEHECTGRYVAMLTNCDLVDKPWTRGYAPFIKLDYCEALVGWWGQGLAEQLEGYQYELNYLEDRVLEAFRMVPGLWILAPSLGDGNPIASHFVNGVGRVLTHAPGQPPQMLNPEPVHPQMFQRIESLLAHGIRETGQTELATSGSKPAGIEAAAALRELVDIGSTRHVVLLRRAEEACLEYARQLIDCNKEIAEEYGDASVDVPMADGFVELSWKDCNVESYQLRVFSGSLLPQQRASRMQMLLELYTANPPLIDRETFMRQLDAADLKAELDLKTAGKMLVDEQIEAMLMAEDPDAEDAYHPPSQFVDPDWALARVEDKISWATLKKANPANLLLLHKFAADIGEMKMKAIEGQQALNGPPAPPEGGPMPMGGPPMPGVPPVDAGLMPPMPDVGMVPPGMPGPGGMA